MKVKKLEAINFNCLTVQLGDKAQVRSSFIKVCDFNGLIEIVFLYLKCSKKVKAVVRIASAQV